MRGTPAFAVKVAIDPSQPEAVTMTGPDTIVGRSLEAMARWGIVLQTAPPTLWNTENDRLYELPPIACECGGPHKIEMGQILRLYQQPRHAQALEALQ